MIEILLFLASLGCTPRAAIEYDATLDRPGRQQGTLVRVRTADPGVWVHELYHACQEAAAGPASTDAESAEREEQARVVELLWRHRDR